MAHESLECSSSVPPAPPPRPRSAAAKVVLTVAAVLILVCGGAVGGIYYAMIQVKKVATDVLDEAGANFGKSLKEIESPATAVPPPPPQVVKDPLAVKDGSDLTSVVVAPPDQAVTPAEFDPPQLLFSSRRDGNAEIYVCNLNGDNLRNLSNNPADDLSPAWSPDGKRIVFTSTRDRGRRQLFVMDADGKNVKQLTSGDESRCPAWSPDGRKIAFARHVNGGNAQVFLMDADGKNAKNLVNDTAFSADPAWSPDGKQIAFASNRSPGGFRLYVMDADGKNVKEYTPKANPIGAVYPAWSPDGKTIAFSGMLNAETVAILAIDADGKNLRALAQAAGKNTFCTWSPDGKALAFANFVGPSSRVYTVGPDGGVPQPLLTRARVGDSATVVDDDGRISWRPRVTEGIDRLAAANALLQGADKLSGDERHKALREAARAYQLALPSFTDADQDKIMERLGVVTAAIDAEDAKHGRYTIYEGAWRATFGKIKRDYLIHGNGDIIITSATDDHVGAKGKVIRKDGVVLFWWEDAKAYDRPKMEGKNIRLDRFAASEYPAKVAQTGTAVYLGKETPKEGLKPEKVDARPWKELITELGRFSASFPGEARVGGGVASDGLGSGRASVTDGKTYFEVRWQDYSRIVGQNLVTDQDVCNRRGEFLSRDATSKKKLQLGSFPGLEYTKANERARLFSVRNRLYHLRVVSRGDPVAEETVKRFFDSFQPSGVGNLKVTEEKPAEASPRAPAKDEGPIVKATMPAHGKGVTSLVFSADSKTLYSAGLDETIKIWDIASAKSTKTLPAHTSPIYSIALSPDGTMLASSSHDQTVKLWDLATGKVRAVLKGHKDTVSCVRFSSDGKTLATASFDKTLAIWDIASGKAIATLEGHKGRVHALAYSPDGKLLVSGGAEGNIKLWDVAAGKEKATWAGHTNTVECITFSADGKQAASGGREQRGINGPGKARLWNVETGKEVVDLVDSTRCNSVLAIAYSRDGKTLAIAGESPWIRFIDLATGKETATLKSHRFAIGAVAFSPDGKMLASGSTDETIKLWELAPAKDTPKP